METIDMKNKIIHGGFIPTNPNMDEREFSTPAISWEGELEHGTIVMKIDKNTIWIFLPESTHGLRLTPNFIIRGWCPICQAETDAVLLIMVEETVQDQVIVCMNCSEHFKVNPQIFKQPIAIYDSQLDNNFFTTLPPEYIQTIQKIIKERKEIMKEE